MKQRAPRENIIFLNAEEMLVLLFRSAFAFLRDSAESISRSMYAQPHTFVGREKKT